MLLAAAACAVGAGRYREEVRMMQEVIDLSDDLIDRYRRNDDRLLKLQEFTTGEPAGQKATKAAQLMSSALELSGGGAAGVAEESDLAQLQRHADRLIELLRQMKALIERSSAHLDGIMHSYSLLLQVESGPDAGADAGAERRRRRRRGPPHALTPGGAPDGSPVAGRAESSPAEQPVPAGIEPHTQPASKGEGGARGGRPLGPQGDRLAALDALLSRAGITGGDAGGGSNADASLDALLSAVKRAYVAPPSPIGRQVRTLWETTSTITTTTTTTTFHVAGAHA